MKMENQYKSEGELYLLFNLLRNPIPHTASFLMHLMPIGWDNERVISNVIELAKEFDLKLSNFYFDPLLFETAHPESFERINKAIKGKPGDKNVKLQKRFFENKFSISDIEEELQMTLDKTLDYILGGQKSVLEAVSFDVAVSSQAKAKIEKRLEDYIEKFISDKLAFTEKNIYTFEKHKKIFSGLIKKLQGDHGNELIISSVELMDKKFLFIHCLLAFEQLGYLNAKTLRVNEDYWPTGKDGYYEAQVGLLSSVPAVLHLNSVGDFWREPKEKYCYPMGETSDRHKIVRYLATHNGYQKTSDVALALEKGEQSIRKEIGKIRDNIEKFLKLNGNEVIESRKESGYRIGSSYKIISKS
jgi:hypothetical protein